MGHPLVKYWGCLGTTTPKIDEYVTKLFDLAIDTHHLGACVNAK